MNDDKAAQALAEAIKEAIGPALKEAMAEAFKERDAEVRKSVELYGTTHGHPNESFC